MTLASNCRYFQSKEVTREIVIYRNIIVMLNIFISLTYHAISSLRITGTFYCRRQARRRRYVCLSTKQCAVPRIPLNCYSKKTPDFIGHQTTQTRIITGLQVIKFCITRGDRRRLELEREGVGGKGIVGWLICQSAT